MNQADKRGNSKWSAEDDTANGITLTDEQVDVKKAVMEGKNVFLTGPHLTITLL